MNLSEAKKDDQIHLCFMQCNLLVMSELRRKMYLKQMTRATQEKVLPQMEIANVFKHELNLCCSYRTTVYEFYGCYWLGCPKFTKNRHQLTANNDTITICKHNDEDRALNSTWVMVELYKALEKEYKFGQQSNMDKTIIHNATEEYFKLMMNVVKIDKNVRLINEQLVSMTYCQHDDFAEVMGNTNAVIAAYTTAQARLKPALLLSTNKSAGMKPDPVINIPVLHLKMDENSSRRAMLQIRFTYSATIDICFPLDRQSLHPLNSKRKSNILSLPGISG
uniref:Uncharacterized protein n=1 Tax=Romanomermis culicivorax TaxID=13658 RepID=A0A915HRL0_ROMCU